MYQKCKLLFLPPSNFARVQIKKSKNSKNTEIDLRRFKFAYINSINVEDQKDLVSKGNFSILENDNLF